MAYAPSKESLIDPQGRQIPWFTVEGNVNPISPELAAALAGVVIDWSVFENSIASDTSEMMRWPIVRKLTDVAPRTFKQKIELWRRSVRTLYRTVPCYIEVADEVCSNGKIISTRRNHLIHGHWLPPSGDGSEYTVLVKEGLDKLTRIQKGTATVEVVGGLRNDIRTLIDALYSFTTTRMIHAHLGLMKANVAPKP